MQGNGPAAGLAHLKQILDEGLEPHRLLVQYLDVGIPLLLGNPLLLEQIHIGDDGCQGRFQVMGHIRDELRLGALALYLLGHGLLKALLDFCKLVLKGIENSQILRNLHIQAALCHAVDSIQQHLVLFLHPAPIFFYQEKQAKGINNQRPDAPEPQAGNQGQDKKVDDNCLSDKPGGMALPVRIPEQIQGSLQPPLDEAAKLPHPGSLLKIPPQPQGSHRPDTGNAPVEHTVKQRPEAHIHRYGQHSGGSIRKSGLQKLPGQAAVHKGGGDQGQNTPLRKCGKPNKPKRAQRLKGHAAQSTPADIKGLHKGNKDGCRSHNRQHHKDYGVHSLSSQIIPEIHPVGARIRRLRAALSPSAEQKRVAAKDDCHILRPLKLHAAVAVITGETGRQRVVKLKSAGRLD